MASYSSTTTTTTTTTTSVPTTSPNLMPPPPEGAQPDWRYEGVRYGPSDVPPVLPPTGDLLPSERKEVRTLEAQEIQQQKTIEAYDRAQAKKEQGGFRNNLSAFFGPHVAKLRSRPGRIREDIPSERDEKRYNDRFHFQRKERLLYASKNCKLVTGKNMQIIGKLYVSENYLSFRESHLQPRAGQRQPVLFSIPLTDIYMLGKGITLREYQPGEVAEYRALDTHIDGADAIFVYTREGILHRFATFWTQQSYNDTFTVLDRQWRTLTGKPIGPVNANPTGVINTTPIPMSNPNPAFSKPTDYSNVRTTVMQPTYVVEQTSTTTETMKN